MYKKCDLLALTSRRRYGSSEAGAVLAAFFTWCFWISIPCTQHQLAVVIVCDSEEEVPFFTTNGWTEFGLLVCLLACLLVCPYPAPPHNKLASSTPSTSSKEPLYVVDYGLHNLYSLFFADILCVVAGMSHADPYADYPPSQGASAPQNGDTHDAPRGRSRSRSPTRNGGGGGGYRSPGGRSPPYRRRSPPPRKPHHAPVVGAPPPQNNGNNANANPNKTARPQNPNPTHVLGVFGLSIRTQERDLEEEFGRFGRVEKVTIVYDQRVRFGVSKNKAQILT